VTKDKMSGVIEELFDLEALMRERPDNQLCRDISSSLRPLTSFARSYVQLRQVMRPDYVAPYSTSVPGPSPSTQSGGFFDLVTNVAETLVANMRAVDSAITATLGPTGPVGPGGPGGPSARGQALAPFATLMVEQVAEEEGIECSICREVMIRGSPALRSSCCNRQIVLHHACAVQCITQNQLCPFCRSYNWSL